MFSYVKDIYIPIYVKIPLSGPHSYQEIWISSVPENALTLPGQIVFE